VTVRRVGGVCCRQELTFVVGVTTSRGFLPQGRAFARIESEPLAGEPSSAIAHGVDGTSAATEPPSTGKEQQASRILLDKEGVVPGELMAAFKIGSLVE